MAAGWKQAGLSQQRVVFGQVLIHAGIRRDGDGSALTDDRWAGVGVGVSAFACRPTTG